MEMETGMVVAVHMEMKTGMVVAIPTLKGDTGS